MKNTLADTAIWFGKAIPIPTVQNFTTQMGVHFEEVAEMLAEISPNDLQTHEKLGNAIVAIKSFADHLKTHAGCVHIEDRNRINYLDSLCDQIVTAVGCAHMAHMDIVAAMNETNRSNYSKFDENGNPIFNPETQKVMKGPNYTKSDLTPFI